MSTYNALSEKDSVQQVQTFWNANPCGAQTASVGKGLEFFRQVEAFRYTLEPHILEVVPFAIGRGKKVLEVGCGLGTDGIHWAEAGAHYTGIDLTSEAVRLASENFSCRGLQGRFIKINAEQIPFLDASFDIVYSHGVIHHAPNIDKVVSEIHRVLRPGGKAILMVYHRHSYNYYLNILLLRRLGVLLLLLPGGLSLAQWITREKRETLQVHKNNLKKKGWKYLRTQEFLNANTDGPNNPLSRVYSKKEAIRLLKAFSMLRTEVRYLNRRRVPILGKMLPKKLHDWLSSRWGWHLYLFVENQEPNTRT